MTKLTVETARQLLGEGYNMAPDNDIEAVVSLIRKLCLLVVTDQIKTTKGA
ncbi:MAG: hypothetical protein V4543_07415 [Bacteroidota bacterium]